MSHPKFMEYEKSMGHDLEEFDILKNTSQRDLDEITFLASQVCKAPVAVMRVVNGETWIKSVYGIFKDEVPLEDCFWRPVLEEKKVLCVKDIRLDERFQKISTTEFIFYAGVPLITSQGNPLGVLYVLDRKTNELDLSQKTALEVLANQILKALEYQKQNNELRRIQQNLEQKYEDLEKFASVVSHDIKSPLANIISLTELLREENKDKLSPETQQYLDYLSQASYSLRSYVDGLLIFYRSEKILEKEEEDVDLHSFFKNIAELYQVGEDVEIKYPTSGKLQKVNKAALTQIFLNLISNSLKYNDKDYRRVSIIYWETENYYKFEVRDNGNGIPEKDFKKIFDLFTTLDHDDREGNTGSGIGLATVKKLLHHMHGDIEVESTPGEGSSFIFKIKR